MKTILSYILAFIFSGILIGCKDDFDGSLLPTLKPSLTTPSESTADISLSEFSPESNWDNSDDQSSDFKVDDFDKDQDWDEPEDSSTDINIGDFGDDKDWNENGNTETEFNTKGWSSDINWNN